MMRLLNRLGRKLMCQIACQGTTVVRRDARTGKVEALVYCKRCERILETEECPFPVADVRQRRVA